MVVLLEHRARVSYAENSAKDNSLIESFWGRFETENGQLILEARIFEEVRRIVTAQLEYYNLKRRHSALDYGRPYEVVLAATTAEDARPGFSRNWRSRWFEKWALPCFRCS
jgi:transposase InsO family protein